MKLLMCELLDFKTIKATARLETDSNEDDIRFILLQNGQEQVCEIIKEHEKEGIHTFELSLFKALSLTQARNRLEILCVSGNNISKKRVKKIAIIEYFAKQAQDVNFFPRVKKNKTFLQLFSPLAQKVSVELITGNGSQTIVMEYDKRGFWYKVFNKNLHLMKYHYKIMHEGQEKVTIDPFSVAVSCNSKESVIVDFDKLDYEKSDFKNPKNKCACIIYETHIRDFTSDPTVPFKNRNKYLGFVEEGVKIDDGCCVGINHLKELGITHVHLLPLQDFQSVNDKHNADYNWGYDPLCYSVPEGSYSTDPDNPLSRITELRDMIKTLHENSIGVILDVVYNHTYEQAESIFNQTLLDYAYRWTAEGTLSNGSGCGNEVASERLFMRKYIIDTLEFWIDKYDVDGFRFDLMGLMDKETMYSIEKRLLKKKELVLYGEPWAGGLSVLDEKKRAIKGFQRGHSIAIFNDDLRNAIKGFPDDDSKGFIQSELQWTDTLLGSMLGAAGYEEGLIDMVENPSEQILYNSCHDNLTLFDKIKKSSPGLAGSEWLDMNRLTAFTIIMSQGILFLHSGEEFARTKFMNPNTYNLGDAYNSIIWHQKSQYYDLFNYYKNLISIRKEHPVFHLCEREEIESRINLIHKMEGAFAYTIDGRGIDSWNHAIIAVNMTDDALWFRLPELSSGEGWNIIVNKYHAGNCVLGIAHKELQLSERSWFLLYV